MKSDEIVKDDRVKSALYNRTINKLFEKKSHIRDKNARLFKRLLKNGVRLRQQEMDSFQLKMMKLKSG